MRTNGSCRSVHEGSPGDKHSTRVKVESGGNLANPTGCEEGWPRLTGWLELGLGLALAGEAIPAGGRARMGQCAYRRRAPRSATLALRNRCPPPVSVTGGQNLVSRRGVSLRRNGWSLPLP